jgi:hypothetical protein
MDQAAWTAAHVITHTVQHDHVLSIIRKAVLVNGSRWYSSTVDGRHSQNRIP